MKSKLPLLLLVLLAVVATLFVVFRQGPETTEEVAAVTPDTGAGPATPAPSEERVSAPANVDDRVDAAEEPGEDIPGEIEEATKGNARVVGVVLNSTNAPIEGATVKLSMDAMMGESLAMDWFANKESTGQFLTTTTDAKGQYVFRGVDPGRSYYVMASHPEYSAVQEDGLRVPKSGEVRAPDLILRAGSVFRGYVSDTTGAPIADAQIDIDSAYMMSFEMASPDRLTARTDGQGFFEFKNVSPGPRIISAWADGFERQIHHDRTFTGAAGEVQEMNFTLNLGQPIVGRVFGPENEPVVGAKVYAINYGSNVQSRGEALSDEQGNFQITGLAQSSYVLMVQSKGYRMARQNRVSAGDVNVELEMLRQSSLSGRVYDLSTNAPVRDFKVSLLHVNTAIPIQGSAPLTYEPTEVRETVKGSEDGSFTLVGVDPGTFAVKVTASGFASTVSDTFSVADGASAPPLSIGLTKGGSIRGRIVDGASGKPIAGATISTRDGDLPDAMATDPFLDGAVASRATERKVRSGADGLFEAKLLNPGRYRLQVEHPEFTSGWVVDVVVLQGQQNDVGSVQLYPGGSVEGKVVDASGAPCARCIVSLYSIEANEQYQDRTDAEGRYSIAHVRPGDYRLAAARSSGAPTDAIDQIVEQQQSEVQVRVLEGQATNRDVAIGN